MKPFRAVLAALAISALSIGASARELPNFDVLSKYDVAQASSRSPLVAKARELAAPGSTVQVHEALGVPTFVWAANPGDKRAYGAQRDAVSAARAHMGSAAKAYGLTQNDINGADAFSVHDTGEGGVIVRFRQSVAGIEVFRDEMSVLMNRDLQLVAISGYLASADAGRKTPMHWSLRPAEAVATAIADISGKGVNAGAIDAREEAVKGSYGFYMTAASAPVQLSEPARVRRVLYHLPGGLEPAYYVEAGIGSGSDGEYYSYVISARDGSLLFRNNLIANDSFTYKVWADATGTKVPHDGPQGRMGAHPTGVPDGYQAPFVAPNNVTLQNGPISTNDPWLAPGATFTNGNNADAYADISGGDGYDGTDFRAQTTSVNTFDRLYDLGALPNSSNAQQQAAITQLFYNVNWFHDWYYDAGFKEADGNAQNDNYGRGGLGGDRLRAEAQDASGRNNANMQTPADGARPRMQMYIFDANTQRLLVTDVPAAATYPTGGAVFGAKYYDVVGNIVYADDGVVGTGGTIHDGCEGGVWANRADITGHIAFIDRGGVAGCGFEQKAMNAQTNGAIGVIIANISTSANREVPPTMGAATPALGAAVPSLSIGYTNAEIFRGYFAASQAVHGNLNHPSGIDRDGSLDNQIVAHEWGHYISNRLVSNAAGLTNNQGRSMGEGWADFHALLMTVKPEDLLNPTNANYGGVYPLAGYVDGGLDSSGAPNNGWYFGIRRVPYSTNMNKDPLTFKHIANGNALPALDGVGNPIPYNGGSDGSTNSEVHNSGEVWASALWECYASLLRDTGRLTFAQAQTRMKNYLVAGYKLTPPQPTFTEARDAILAAAYANDIQDFNLFWAAFARRGMGVRAVSPSRTSTTHVGVVESFVTGGLAQVTAASVTDNTALTCDGDGYIDNGEVGRINFTVKNVGISTLSDITATISANDAAVTFPSGASVLLSSVAPYATVNGSVDVAINGAATVKNVTLTITLTSPSFASGANPGGAIGVRMNVDDVQNASASDDVESANPAWFNQGTVFVNAWQRAQLTTFDWEWFGIETSTRADQSLVSPVLAVGSGPFSFTYQQRYAFETAGGVNYDGGVIEISTDDGATWNDIGAAAFTSNGYNGVITASSDNPIVGATNRPGFVGTSAGFSSFQSAAVSLGTTYANQNVRLRFRMGTDTGGSVRGWEINNMVFTGLTNTPFSALVANLGVCRAASSVALAASAEQSSYGYPVTLTATVSPETATGTVTFFDGAASLGSANVVSGVATKLTTALGIGTRNVTATYNGDAALRTSTSNVVTVQVLNDVPVANDDSYSVTANSSLTVAAPGVLGNDVNYYGSPLTATKVTGPANGTLTLLSTGGFTYTPNVSYAGSDSFTYSISDGALTGNAATVSITVNSSSPTITSIAPRSAPGTSEASFDITGTNFVAGASVSVDGNARPMLYHSSTSLSSSIPVAGAGTVHSVTVSNPDSGTTTLARAFLSDFSDVNWTNVFYNFVTDIALAEITTGYGDGTYHPAEIVTRDKMAAFIARALAGSDGAIPAVGEANGQPYSCTSGGTSLFTDVLPTNQFCRHIHFIYAENVTTGYGDGTFRPTAAVSRTATASFVARALVHPAGDAGIPTSVTLDGTGFNQYGKPRAYDCTDGEPNYFSDVPDSAAACSAIYNVWARGVIDGYPNQTYGPLELLPRDAMAKFLSQAFLH